MVIRFLPDKPIESLMNDTLKYRSFMELIRDSVRETSTPFVFGVLGDWGTGKTSILQLLSNRLSVEESEGVQFVSIWFNAWKYENDLNMIYPLLHQIKEQYEKLQLEEGDRMSFQNKFLKVVSASALAMTDLGLRAVTNAATGEALSMKDVAEHLKTVENKADQLAAVLGEWTDKVASLEAAFAALIEKYAATFAKNRKVPVERVRFVILVDDLDRCLPDRALAVLESIKNFLSVSRCVFILGLNPDVIYAGIQVKYQGARINGREYLEKILNYSYYIPEPLPEAVEEFSVTQLTQLIGEPEIQQKLQTSFKEFGKVLNDCRFTNPRKIKRILNRYLLFLKQFETNLDKYILSNVAKLFIMAENFPDLFQLYLTESNGPKELRKIGTGEFKLEQFEAQSGISLGGIYAQLTRMRILFLLTEPLPAENKKTVVEHAEAVFSISRLK